MNLLDSYSEKNEITNLREISAGNIKKGVIFRGSYPREYYG